MKISNLKTTVISIPFGNPVRWKYGVWEGVTGIIVEVETDEGIVGIGESSCLFRPAEAVRLIIEEAKRFILGEDPFNIERISKKLYGYGFWHFARHYGNYALSGIDTALWDIIGKTCNQPLYKLLGGPVRKKIPFMKFIRDDDPVVMAKEAKEAVEKGYGTLYVKYTTISRLTEAIIAIRESVGFKPKLRIDFNQTLSPGFAVKYLTQIERYDIEFVEQPVLATDLMGMAYVRKSVSIPIASHESSWTLYDVLNTIRMEAADVIHVDARATDGILNCKKAAGIAEAAGLPVVMHSGAEMGIAQAMFLHVIASTPNFIYANQTTYDYYSEDYIKGGKLELKDGCMVVPEKPGIGVELDPAKVEEHAEHYKKVGTYAIAGIKDEHMLTAEPPLLPSY